MKCEICGKTQVSKNKVSHSNIKTRAKQLPNVQKVRAVVEGEVRRVQVCTRCIRSGKITKAA